MLLLLGYNNLQVVKSILLTHEAGEENLRKRTRQYPKEKLLFININ